MSAEIVNISNVQDMSEKIFEDIKNRPFVAIFLDDNNEVCYWQNKSCKRDVICWIEQIKFKMFQEYYDS